MTSVLITGLDGFIGSHLAEFIINRCEDVTVYGTVRRLADKTNLTHIDKQVRMIDCELTDSISVENAVKKARPDKIFHLAAQSFVPTSWTSPTNTLDTNVKGTMNVLEAARKVCPSAFIQVAGSSEEYGMVYPHECPISEESPLRPLSPYGVSKVATDLLGYQYARSYGMNVLRTRTFNQTGPRRGEAFVDANFAKQIVLIEKEKQSKLLHGNLDAVRDFTDVRDTVRAYWKLSDKRWQGDVVNICSGKGHSVREILQTLTELSNADIVAVEDPERMRPSDVPLLIGDNRRLGMYIDWAPVYSWEESLEDLLNYSREKF